MSARRKVAPGAPLAERILFHTDRSGDCWIWTSSIRRSNGYGQLTYEGRGLLAHRASYEAFVGPIPEGLQLDHLCRVRACVNPAHLEPVDSRTNLHRSPLTSAGKTHCKHGHEFTPENTIRRQTEGRVKRVCRICYTRQYNAANARRRRVRAA